MRIQWRIQYQDPELDEAIGRASAPPMESPDMAVQEYKDDSDINVLMQRFRVTGTLPVGSLQPFYADFTGVGTYQESLNAVIDAQEAFDALPSAIRNRFRNDPAELIAFVQDPETNREEGEKLGLFERTAKASPDPLPREPEPVEPTG